MHLHSLIETNSSCTLFVNKFTETRHTHNHESRKCLHFSIMFPDLISHSVILLLCRPAINGNYYLLLWTRLSVNIPAPDVEHVVAPDQNLPEVAGGGPVYELLSVGQLEVHVAVGGHQEALVLVTPLELDHHLLPRQLIEEGLGVYWHSSGHLDLMIGFI